MGVVSWNRVLARIVRNPSPLNDARLLSSLFRFVSSWGRPLAILSRVNRPSSPRADIYPLPSSEIVSKTSPLFVRRIRNRGFIRLSRRWWKSIIPERGEISSRRAMGFKGEPRKTTENGYRGR